APRRRVLPDPLPVPLARAPSEPHRRRGEARLDRGRPGLSSHAARSGAARADRGRPLLRTAHRDDRPRDPRRSAAAAGPPGRLFRSVGLAAAHALGGRPPPRLPSDDQSTIVLGMPTAGISDRERPAYALLRHILAGFDERLYDEIREKRGYAYWIRAEGLEFSAAGAFGISTGAKEKYFPEIEEIVRKELSRIATAPVSPEELARAVRYMRTEEARSDETNAGRVAVIAGDMVDGTPLRTFDERVARLAAVTPEQIRQLARRLFEGKRLAVVT